MRITTGFIAAVSLALLAALAAPVAPVSAAGTGSISGRVTNAAGDGIRNAQVFAYVRGATSSFGFANTADDGTYTVTGLGSGSYEVMFETYRGAYATERFDNYYGDLRYPGDSELVAVVDGQDTPGIDAVLAPGGTITGTVGSGITGLPVPYPRVCAIDAAGGVIRCSSSRADGSYWLPGLLVGSYGVQFYAPQDSGLLGEYYSNTHDLAMATPVTVEAGQETGPIDAVLDNAGRDTTPPTITLISRSPAPNDNDWYASPVTLTWLCTDSDSGPVETVVSVTESRQGEDLSVTGECRDNAGNVSTEANPGINIDFTDPAITRLSRLPEANSDGWNSEAVTVTWTCTDEVSGPVAPTVAATVGTEGADQAANGTCFDKAGNSASASVSGISIDTQKPTVSWQGAFAGEYVFGTVPSAPTCTAHDAGSGPKDCVVSGYSTAVGTHVLTATAYDRALNTATDTRTYTVLPWTFRGFRPPVNMSTWNVVSAGSTLPLKFEVFAGATELTATSVVTGVTASHDEACTSAATRFSRVQAAPGSGTLTYDAKAGFFIQKWKVPKTPGALLALSVNTQDGSHLTACVKVK